MQEVGVVAVGAACFRGPNVEHLAPDMIVIEVRDERDRVLFRKQWEYNRCASMYGGTDPEVADIGIIHFEQVGPRFAEFRFVTKDPLPTNPLAAIMFAIIKNANVFEFGGTIRNFLDKREIVIGYIFSIEIEFRLKESKGNQGSEQVFNPLSEGSLGL